MSENRSAVSKNRLGKDMLRAGVALVLVICLSVAFIPNAVALIDDTVKDAAASERDAASSLGQTAEYEKSEVVYASLTAAGAPQALYVVNRFDVDAPGIVVDFGNYDSVKNLTDETALEYARGAGDALGATTFSADEGVFYYQGNVSAGAVALPWDIGITYELDGREVPAETLGGATGNLAVRVSVARNESVAPEFFESFMLQITFTLDGAAVSDIVADGATVASSGKDWTVAFTALPGHEGSFDLTARVNNFSMGGAQIAALPYSSVMEMPETDSMVSEMDSLTDAASQLASGAQDLSEGARELSEGARGLSSGAASFGEGMTGLATSALGISQASAQIETSLAQTAESLGSLDVSGLAGMSQLSTNLRAIADALDALAASSASVGAGVAQSTSAVDAAMESLVANAPTEQEIAALREAVSGEAAATATVEKLVSVYKSAQAAKSAWDGAKAGISGAEDFLGTLCASADANGALAAQAQALRTLADGVDASFKEGSLDGLSDLSEGIARLAGEYSLFHEGLVAYASGVAAVAENYGAIEAGASGVSGGAEALADGAALFADGAATFDSSVAELPRIMRERIDSLMADYDFPAFDPVSFTSLENTSVSAVQFVMTTPAIDAPKPVAADESEAHELTIWDRFVALFAG